MDLAIISKLKKEFKNLNPKKHLNRWWAYLNFIQKLKNWVFVTNSNYMISIFSQPVGVTWITWSNRIHSLEYLRSATYIDLNILEFVAKTNFLCILKTYSYCFGMKACNFHQYSFTSKFFFFSIFFNILQYFSIFFHISQYFSILLNIFQYLLIFYNIFQLFSIRFNIFPYFYYSSIGGKAEDSRRAWYIVQKLY